jgi:hypothetical protein
MAGLLESLKNIQFQPSAGNMGLLQMGAQMLANSGPSLTPTNFGTALGQGLNGFTQGYTGFQDREQRNLMDQARLKLLQERVAQQAQSAQRGHDPYFQAIPTSDGYISFNARSGEFAPLMSNGNPLKQPASDPSLQGRITRAKEGEKIKDITLSDGRQIPARMGDVVNTTLGNASLSMRPETINQLAGKSTGDPQLDALIAQSQAKYNQRLGQSTADKKAAEVIGKTQAEAAIGLPKAEAQADYTDKLLEELKTHPGMSGVVGMPNWSGIVPLPGTPEADFRARLKQVQGQQFLSAFETLKGGGQITEMEGKKATEAMGRLSASQSEDEFKKSITELQGIISGAKERARKRAGGMTQSGAGTGDDKKKRLEALRAKHLGR